MLHSSFVVPIYPQSLRDSPWGHGERIPRNPFGRYAPGMRFLRLPFVVSKIPLRYLVFFPFLKGFGPNFLRGRPLSLLDLRFGWSSGWATAA